MTIQEPLSDLIVELNKQLKPEDLKDLLNASKNEAIEAQDLNQLSTPEQWLSMLVEKLLLTNDDLSFIEHVFELCRRPDLLTTVLQHRMKNVDVFSEDSSHNRRQITRMCSAKKYAADKIENQNVKSQSDLKLSDPPKTRRRSTAT